MSLPGYEPSLRIEPQRSRLLLFFLLFNFSGATLILLLVLPAWGALLLTIALWAYFYRLYRHHILRRTPRTIRLLVRETGGEWLMHTLDGIEREVTLSPSSYVHPQLIILILQAEGKRYTLPLLRDSLSADCFRALSVRLRVGQGSDTGIAGDSAR